MQFFITHEDLPLYQVSLKTKADPWERFLVSPFAVKSVRGDAIRSAVLVFAVMTRRAKAKCDKATRGNFFRGNDVFRQNFRMS